MDTPTIRPELTGLPRSLETTLTDALVAGLPANDQPAPWECHCTGLLWFGRGGGAARRALPPGLRGHRALATIGGFVRYAETPVGPYDEVLGMVASHSGSTPWGHVAFMSVDSRPSLVGGRTNWAMPKTLSRFAGAPADGSTMSGRSDDGAAWSVSATPRAFGPSIPLRGRGQARQEFADGRVGSSRLTFEGRVRLALLTVDVQSEGPLADWLRPGRHLGAVVERAVFTLGEPRFG
jgi:hypothetical protein